MIYKHASLQLEQFEERTNLSTSGKLIDILPPPIVSTVQTSPSTPAFVVGSGEGTSSFVDVYSSTGGLLSVINPFPGYNGPLSVALDTVDPAGPQVLIVGTGVGSSQVKMCFWYFSFVVYFVVLVLIYLVALALIFCSAVSIPFLLRDDTDDVEVY